MQWKRSPVPPTLNPCECGSDVVEQRADGLVREYRCAECELALGDLMMGHEP